jgi:tRNA A58 N-methylase Trm61
MELHVISLEQDAENIRKAMDELEDLESEEYNNLEVEDIYTNGQIVATRHILKMAREMEEK